jgi:1,4-dihydroxy-2-naphthoate octaprenyltransferase
MNKIIYCEWCVCIYVCMYVCIYTLPLCLFMYVHIIVCPLAVKNHNNKQENSSRLGELE